MYHAFDTSWPLHHFSSLPKWRCHITLFMNALGIYTFICIIFELSICIPFDVSFRTNPFHVLLTEEHAQNHFNVGPVSRLKAGNIEADVDRISVVKMKA